MINNNSSKQHALLDEKTADKLLDLLARDDAFRASFQQNPAKALADMGYEPLAANTAPTAGDSFYCMTTVRLASKQEILESRDRLRAYLTAEANHSVVHAFESGKMASILSRT